MAALACAGVIAGIGAGPAGASAREMTGSASRVVHERGATVNPASSDMSPQAWAAAVKRLSAAYAEAGRVFEKAGKAAAAEHSFSALADALDVLAGKTDDYAAGLASLTPPAAAVKYQAFVVSKLRAAAGVLRSTAVAVRNQDKAAAEAGEKRLLQDLAAIERASARLASL